MSTDAASLPTVLIRGRSVMALVIAPEWPLKDWLGSLDQQIRRTLGLFDQRPVVVQLGAAPPGGDGPKSVVEALDALAARGLKVIGVEGVEAARLNGTRWARLAILPPGREALLSQEATGATRAPETAPPTSLLVDGPVRSGQSIVFEQGAVTIIGPVASGAEVVAGGSIHIYGPLRGRAIAGVIPQADARIFCRKMEAELVAVDGLYRMAEHWGEDLHGRPAQVRRDDKTLAITALA